MSHLESMLETGGPLRQMKTFKRIRRTIGTTLIEILVVIVVFLVGILAVIQIFPKGFQLLLLTRSKLTAQALAREYVEQLKSRPDQLPSQIVSAHYDNGNIVIDSGKDPNDLGPIGTTLNINGFMTDAALNGLGNWQFLTASNVTRRVIGEGQRVPAPQVVGAAGSGTAYLGGLMVLQFGPINYVPAVQNQVSNLSVYGNDFEQIVAAPVQGALRYDYQYYVTSPYNSGITLQVPSGAATDANNPSRAYRVSFSAYIQVGTQIVRRDYTELQPVIIPGQATDTTGQYPLEPIPLANLVAPDTIVSVDLNSLNVQRYFRQLAKDPSQSFSQTDPYEYKLLNENLGVLLFNPLGNGTSITREGHDREPLTARVNYDVYDWRILHDDFRIDNGVLPGVQDANNTQILTAEHKLPVGSLKVAGMAGVDGLPITPIPPLELATNNGTTDTSAANGKGADNFVLMDMATGGVYFENVPGDPNTHLITVDKSTGIVTITSDPNGNTGGISEWLLLPDGSPPANVQIDNRAVRALYMTKQEYSVQVLKAASQYTVSPTALNLTTGQFYIGGTTLNVGGPTRIFFPLADNGRKVTVGEVAYTSNADGFVHHLFAQDFLVSNQISDPTLPGLPFIDIGSVDGTAIGVSFTNGFGARGIKGASVAVRVLWNPTAFSLTSDSPTNLQRLNQWESNYRRSTNETFLQKEDINR